MVLRALFLLFKIIINRQFLSWGKNSRKCICSEVNLGCLRSSHDKAMWLKTQIPHTNFNFCHCSFDHRVARMSWILSAANSFCSPLKGHTTCLPPHLGGACVWRMRCRRRWGRVVRRPGCSTPELGPYAIAKGTEQGLQEEEIPLVPEVGRPVGGFCHGSGQGRCISKTMERREPTWDTSGMQNWCSLEERWERKEGANHLI